MSDSTTKSQVEEHMVAADRSMIFHVAPDSEAGFTARAAGHSIFIQGDTMVELQKTADDAVLCHFGKIIPPRHIDFRFDSKKSHSS